ncbi:MAG: hypothetical protein GC162_19565 [Planctomycetes bacterium]|nr:hypothetical protein [Planctomycetota bacterium]
MSRPTADDLNPLDLAGALKASDGQSEAVRFAVRVRSIVPARRKVSHAERAKLVDDPHRDASRRVAGNVKLGKNSKQDRFFIRVRHILLISSKETSKTVRVFPPP